MRIVRVRQCLTSVIQMASNHYPYGKSLVNERNPVRLVARSEGVQTVLLGSNMW